MDISAHIIAQEPGRTVREEDRQYVFTMSAEAVAGIILSLDNGDVKSAFASAVASAEDLATGAAARPCNCWQPECAHAYRAVPAGSYYADYVGPVCDECASTHMRDYLV